MKSVCGSLGKNFLAKGVHPYGNCFTIFPSFITKETRSVAVMSVVGSPGMASATLPFFQGADFGRNAEELGVVGGSSGADRCDLHAGHLNQSAPQLECLKHSSLQRMGAGRSNRFRPV
jgi:hypothetical protein